MSFTYYSICRGGCIRSYSAGEYQTNAGIHVMTKLLSQSDLGIAQVVGGVAGIVNIGEKIIRSMRVH